ncbi:non-hydrolyzing UDP-N-acetylglucosamine 2-epimerase [Aquisalibacillus elongatus]|uniref:UDP-N-acetylglucosamine 2-epimerase (Non-hydrolysing)/UDP-GlcNAc3NAcA epimerase n=1 Tax=Aquisalibacillus elongatus TaxID=485577 RepID=A0A3N5BWS6_9BACI|nr:UDP-N-acetylglucosamine 2-epimerase (non-hydrolyzing) [Aquisalibacillus elongatus]RPF54208.1 UDP-N-acetylglucosamine 2-epimerase (non-hydrolysing)/UDP-GlcNAc3NAcA epimerase [Aquisalibacillus elongatus]
MKLVTIAGTRPQLVKVAAVSRELRKTFNEILVNTGQHYDYNMAGIFFEQLDIPKPDYDLGVGSMSHGKQTGNMLIKIEEAIEKEIPDGVIVYGDTNSTIAGALVASKLHIPVFHIEAGLRSYNKKMPEEINRIMTDHISNLLFAPTSSAVENLEKENILRHVHQVGDVMYDAVLYNMEIAEQHHSIEQYDLKPNHFILGTIHRAENTDDRERMRGIIKGLINLNDKVFLPLHPRTRKKLEEYELMTELVSAENVILSEPVSYLEMLLLEKHAKAIVTDSGGVQKEAYFAKVPCYTVRDETEWVETVEAGWNQLVNPSQQDLSHLINNFNSVNYRGDLYGDGNASKKITKEIQNYLREML